METKKMGEIYQKIANKMNIMIPVEWNELYLYGEVIENDSTTGYFYFSPQNSNKFEQGLCITENYNVDKGAFKKLRRELFSLFVELYQEYKNNNAEVWSNFTMYLNYNGKFKVDFDYDDVLKMSNSDRRVVWEHKYLGIYPTHEYDKKRLDDYIKDNQNEKK